MVFLLSNLWLPDRGLGMRLGKSQPCGPRVVEGKCSRTLPSGCPTALWQEGSRQRASGNPVALSGGCCSILAGSVNVFIGTVAALASPLASRLFSGKSRMGRSAPYPMKRSGYSYFLYDFFKIII